MTTELFSKMLPNLPGAKGLQTKHTFGIITFLVEHANKTYQKDQAQWHWRKKPIVLCNHPVLISVLIENTFIQEQARLKKWKNKKKKEFHFIANKFLLWPSFLAKWCIWPSALNITFFALFCYFGYVGKTITAQRYRYIEVFPIAIVLLIPILPFVDMCNTLSSSSFLPRHFSTLTPGRECVFSYCTGGKKRERWRVQTSLLYFFHLPSFILAPT